MKRLPLLFTGTLVATLLFAPAMALTFSGGAPAGRTGAPGDFGTCNASGCHAGTAVNGGGGSVSIDGAGEYVPGQPYNFTVTVADGSASIYGFQVTVLNASNQAVGSFEIVNSSETRFAAGSNNHVTHNGPKASSPSSTWDLRWIPPASDAGAITFYAAGNGANDNGGASGDHIYTTTKSIVAGTGTSVEEVVNHVFTLEPVYPNPFTTQATLPYTLKQAAPVVIRVYDALGRMVRLIDQGLQAPGPHQATFAADDLPTGLYFYELRTPTARHTESFMVAR